MARDVFISHAGEDAGVAVEVCALLESRGLRCWMAPRDVSAGAVWDEAILDAIERSRVFLLILSQNANQSPFVKNEVNRAFSQSKPIVTFRLENVAPGRSLELYLARHHWTDAFPPPLGARVESLAGSITALLDPAAAEAEGVETEGGRDYSSRTIDRDANGALRGRTSRPGRDEEQASGRSTPFQAQGKQNGKQERTRPWWRGKTAIAVAAVVLLGALAGAGWLYRSRMGGETIDSLAVLPFVNGSGDPNMEYLSDGIAETLINSLSQLPNLKVMSRDSAFHYKGKDTDAETVGRELGVRAIFKGRVTQIGDNLDISAELIDARDNSHIWGDQYSRKASDIFALQSDIAKEITTALRARLTGDDEKRLAKSYTANPEAYQDYLKGRYWWNKASQEGMYKGIEYFQEAIEKDPSYAAAYAGLADSYELAGFGFLPPKEAFPKAKEAALRALEIDETLAEGHASLGFIKTQYDWDWTGSEREFRRAIDLNPNDATAHQLYGVSLTIVGRFGDAVAEGKRALELDPLSLIANFSLGQAFYFSRQYEQAIEQQRKTLDLDPNYFAAHRILGFAYLKQSMDKEGIAEFEKSFAPGENLTISELGYAYAVSGRRTEAQKMLDSLMSISKRQYVPAMTAARIYVGLGENDKAFEWLAKGYEDRSITSIKVDPLFDPLRSDPRFADLLRRMNLTP